MKRQLAFILARAQIPVEWLQQPSDDNADADVDFQDELPDDLLECLSNSHLSTQFRELGKELGVAEAKSLEDVYKSHLENSRNCPRIQYQISCSDPSVASRAYRNKRGLSPGKSGGHFRQCLRQRWVW